MCSLKPTLTLSLSKPPAIATSACLVWSTISRSSPPPSAPPLFCPQPQYVSFYTFASAFVALQSGYTTICVGNEHSANEINTTHPR